MVSLCSFVPILAFWLWHCRLVKAQREVLAGEVRLTSAVLLRLCGQIWVVCVPHWVVVFLFWFRRVRLRVGFIRKCSCVFCFYEQQCAAWVIPRNASNRVTLVSHCIFCPWKSLREKVTTRNLCDRAISYASSVDLSRHNVMHRRSIWFQLLLFRFLFHYTIVSFFVFDFKYYLLFVVWQHNQWTK